MMFRNYLVITKTYIVMSNKALIVVDMQNDFVTGSLTNPAASKTIPFIKSEIESGNYSKIIFTKDTHFENYLDTQEGKNLPVKHCIHKTEGWEIVDELKPYSNDSNTVLKDTFGYVGWTLELEDCDEAVFVGTCTDICVVSNVLMVKSIFPELKVTVLTNGCSGTTLIRHNAALEVMKSCQVNVVE